MRRRAFIGALGSTAIAAPHALHAQVPAKVVRLGFLPLGSPSNAYDQSLVEAFRQGLRQVGVLEDRDIVLDVLWAGADPDQAVTELMRRGAQILIPCGSSASVAAKRQASSIPIVFISVGDPIAMGLVESLSHPGANATGFSDILADLGGKLVDLSKTLAESAATVDYVWHNSWPDGKNRYQATELAAQALGVTLRPRGIDGIADLEDVFAAMKNGGAKTLIVQPSPFTYRHRDRLILLATHYGLATIFAFPIAAREGALIAYGPDYVHMYQRAPLYVDRILKGTKPADLPVQLPSKVELVVNLKTARALGIEVPLPLLIGADELIE